MPHTPALPTIASTSLTSTSPTPAFVESPTFKERYHLADNTPIVDAYCPIDGTQLVSMRGYDSSSYYCLACDAAYRWGDENPGSLREHAQHYIRQLKEEAGELHGKLTKLEKIIHAAEKKGIM